MASRKQKQLEIQPLPKRLYKQVYGEDYKDSWQLRFSGLSENEKRSVNALLEQHSFKNIYWIPEIDFPRGHKTPDLLIDGKRVEIKEVSNSRSLEKQVSKAYKQVGADGMVIIDTTKSKLTAGEAVRTAELRCGQRNIVRFAIVNNNRLLVYKAISNKKDGSSSAAYAGHEMKPSYIDILPQTTKKSISTIRDSISTVGNFRPRKRTNAYWQRRAEQRLTESERTSESYARQVRKVYQEAQRQTVLEVRKMYEAYYKKDEGFDMQALRSIAPSGDIKRFQAQMREAGLSTYLPDNYKGRMTRLELLNAQMWAQAKMAATKHNTIETVAHRKVYENAYYKTAYDISKGIGGTPSSFSALDTRTVDRVLNAKFQGKNFSERIWGNTDILAKQLKEKLAVAIATGQSLDKTSRDIRERFGVSKYYADRLIRTESNYFHNMATLDSYRSMGIEEFQFVATLDRRTSEVCQHADGKVFKVKDAIVGINVPPLHPNCRSTIVPYLKNYQPKTRVYRDPETGRNKYIYNISYADWKNQFKDEIAKARAKEKVRTQVDRLRVIARAVRTSGTAVANGAVYYDKSLDNLDTQMIDESKQFIEQALERFPDVADWLRDERGGLAITTSNSQQYKAATANDGSLMLLARGSYSDRKKYIETLIKEINHGNKMFVPASKHSVYTTAHEFGHVVEAYLLRNAKRSELMDKYRLVKSELTKEAMSLSTKSERYVKSQMSSYGCKKPQELFAESFASYILGGNSVWAKAMESYLIKKGLIK